MSEKVTSLFGGTTGLPAPNEACIASLRRWLEMAESGELVGVAIAGLCYDGLGRYEVEGTIGGYSMLGALEIAKTELVEAVR